MESPKLEKPPQCSSQREIEDLLCTVPVGRERVIDLSRELLPEGITKVQLVVGERELLREQPPAPIREASPRRDHVFHDVKGFGEYIAKYGGKDTCVFVDVPNQNITAVLNEVAADGFEHVALTPVPHPSMLPWLNAFDKRFELKTALDLFRQNRRVIIDPPGRELLLLLSQVRASSEVTIHAGSGKSCLNGLLVKTQIQGQKHDEVIEIPDTLELVTPLYVSLPPQKVEVDLLVEANADHKITVVMTCANYVQAKVAAFEGMVAELKAMDTEEMIFSYGKPSWTSWRYRF